MRNQPIRMTADEWVKEGERLFGADRDGWRFECPSCHHVATPRQWREAGAGEGEIAFSCIGRHAPTPKEAFENDGRGPCTYAGGGLFRLNPVTVTTPDGKEHTMFAFAIS